MRDAFEVQPADVAVPVVDGRPLTEADAVEIWIARWLRVRRKDLISRYGCDPRRLYEIWWGERFAGSREKAARLFAERYPGLVDRTVFGYRRIARRAAMPDGQLDLFAPRPGPTSSPQPRN